MQPICIVVTKPEYNKAADYFDAQPDMQAVVVTPEEHCVAEAIRRNAASAAVLGVEAYRDQLYEALPPGGVISRFGVGHDGIDKTAATRARLFVTNTPGVLEDAVAEHAIALMLAVIKEIPAFVRTVAQNRWEPLQTTELRGKTLAILGCGAIGRRVARAAAYGFGVRVLGYDVDLKNKHELREKWGFEDVCSDLNCVVGQADFISLHIPAMDATKHFLNADLLRKVRHTAVLINTARGAVVDEPALCNALRNGTLRAAALDVFETEPYVPPSPECDLRTLPNVLMTPHVSSGTREACLRVAQASLDNIRNVRAGNLEQVSLINAEMLNDR
jgi:phosphoglycerate dehydrogenase-like enzyme